jgi:hypothetical protein
MADTPFDGTVTAVGRVVDQARARADRVGFFAAMYSAVTRHVRDLALQGSFDDVDRMAQFVTTFAARYLDAVAARDAGGRMTTSWQVTFDEAAQWRPGVLQHLLMGMTAHIGLDLGIVAAEVATGPQGHGLDALHPDFIAVNDVLASLVPKVEEAVGQVSPAISLLDRAGGRADEFAVSQAIAVARDLAWRNATELCSIDPDRRSAAIAHMDEEVAEIVSAFAHPGLVMSGVLLPIRTMERKSIAETIDVLGSIVPATPAPH